MYSYYLKVLQDLKILRWQEKTDLDIMEVSLD